MQQRGIMIPHTSTWRRRRLKFIAGVSATALMGLGAMMLPQWTHGAALAETAKRPAPKPVDPEKIPTETKIKHVIFIIGENRSYDNIYGTYQPKNGQKIWNLLSQGIVRADGTPGKNFA